LLDIVPGRKKKNTSVSSNPVVPVPATKIVQPLPQEREPTKAKPLAPKRPLRAIDTSEEVSKRAKVDKTPSPKGKEKVPANAPENTAEKASKKASEKASEKSSEKTPEKTPTKTAVESAKSSKTHTPTKPV